MSDTTPIQWADATLNPWGGCTKVSTGCAKCYAEHATPVRAMGIGWGKGAPRHRFTGFEANALRLDRKAAKLGKPLRVFPSLCDWLDAEVPIEWLANFLDVVRRTPHLTWILLTKRPENWDKRVGEACSWMSPLGPYAETKRWLFKWLGGLERENHAPPFNVWFVFSAEDQPTFDRRVRVALAVPAVMHGASLEPLLGEIDVRDWLGQVLPSIHGQSNFPINGLDWIITGGESAEPGDTPRRCEMFWVWAIVVACAKAGVACFVKQLGGYCTTGNANAHDWPEEIEFTAEGDGFAAARVRLSHPKGGDPAEWPEELHVRQWPACPQTATFAGLAR
jgi:protein gp37